jgi:tetratricopeptide (TPR) repeat protein
MRFLTFFLLLVQHYASSQETNIDSLKIALHDAADKNNSVKTLLEITKYYQAVNIDSSAKYLAILKNEVTKLNNARLRASYHLLQGNHFKNTGQFIEGIKEYEKSIDISLKLKDTLGLARAYNSLGLVYKKQGGDNQQVRAFSQKALLYENRSLGLYMALKDTVGLLRAYSNIGIIQRDLKDFKKAETAYLKGVAIAKKARIESYAVGILYANLSQIYLDHYKNYDRAIELLNDAIRIYERNGIRTSMEHAYRNLSYNYTGKKEYQKAIEYAQKAIAIAEEVNDDHRRINAYSSLYLAQKKAGLFEESLANHEHVKSLEDSLLSMDKTTIIAEMDAKFETVKKDAQIKILHRNEEVSRLQKIALLAGVILLVLIAAVIILNMKQRRKREIDLDEKERIIAAEKLRNAELEIRHKQKELTAKVLLLARKNEFLQTLEKEIGFLKGSVDKTVNKASSRISRLIKRDVHDEEQWEQFASEFSNLNQGFLDKLTDTHGSFSKSEARLISLMKMNISAKDIADTLNISNEGIKKARYRLRKKLNLNSEDDIQDYLRSVT